MRRSGNRRELTGKHRERPESRPAVPGIRQQEGGRNVQEAVP
ncbi:hypothetical protein STRIP9103_05642 [Streptomyces ipomoeae 91-03]|uniref:Uncharacterized protein n=1 Tax=Streptomyces ipomoeae 91-03 TaxID=698759 RepID=L1L6F3_9ACTN|nr:hypothetical protein STRIP9103_05642 [Streptomyces ipomoeae 91-03]